MDVEVNSSADSYASLHLLVMTLLFVTLDVHYSHLNLCSSFQLALCALRVVKHVNLFPQ